MSERDPMMKSELDGIRRRNQEKDLTYEGNMNEEHLEALDRQDAEKWIKARMTELFQANTVENGGWAADEQDEYNALSFAISAIERRRWVAVEDAMPPANTPVWVTVKRRTRNSVITDSWDGSDEDGENFRLCNIAWMVKPDRTEPEPYTPKEQI